jgi:two-component system, OmpR family, copper resistance phosphate regulon response regulator CusR
MRVLIVEDDEQLNKALRLALEKEGYAIDTFFDGEKAERHILLNHSNYDLLILDFMLPGKDGIEICTTVRAHDIFTPVLILTAVSDISKKVSALDSGADDYQTKPFSIDELTARVRALLRRPRESATNELKSGKLTLKVSHKQTIYNDKEVRLTLKEFGILEYLLINSDQVISRDQILDHVWDFEANAFSNIVDVHMTNLRKKLEKAGAKDMIQSIRGVGFTIKST